jgi:transposase-like protein
LDVNSRKDKFAKLHALGWTYAEIAAALGVSARTLYKWRKALRLTPRRKGRRKKPEIQ